MQTLYGDREKCYDCYRPKSSCMCSYVNQVNTETLFIILMHPKEFKKVKNGTGHLTHLSLKNSNFFIGIDFTNHKEVNEIISMYQSYILYPSQNSINISKYNLNQTNNEKKAIFIIDATWSCSFKMLRDSKNLQALDYISFDNIKLSQFKIKKQPQENCLSTIESTLSVLEILNNWKIEDLKKSDIEQFLNPFYKMIEHQIECIQNPKSNAVRYKYKRNL